MLARLKNYFISFEKHTQIIYLPHYPSLLYIYKKILDYSVQRFKNAILIFIRLSNQKKINARSLLSLLWGHDFDQMAKRTAEHT